VYHTAGLRAERDLETIHAMEPTDASDTVRQAQAALDGAILPLGSPERHVKRAQAYALHCIILRTAFQRRTLSWRYGAASPTVALHEPVAPDLWAVEITVPTDGRESHQHHVLAELDHACACPPCGGSGRATCRYCRGEGSIRTMVAQSAHPGDAAVTTYTKCAVCHGGGIADCDTCKTTGRVMPTPVAVVETGTVVRVRPVDDGTIPTEVFVECAEVELDGPCVYTERGVEMAPRRASAQGYRGMAPRVNERVDAAIDALLEELLPDNVARACNRVLEVRGVPVFHVDLDNGHPAWLIGSPPRVVPESALTASGGVVGWIARHLHPAKTTDDNG
jgi:hypothetical protein